MAHQATIDAIPHATDRGVEIELAATFGATALYEHHPHPLSLTGPEATSAPLALASSCASCPMPERRVLAYTSSATWAPGEDTIAPQKDACAAYAESKGWELVGAFSDAPRAKFYARRPGLGNVLKAMHLRQIDVLIVQDLSSFGRDSGDAAYVMAVAIEAGVEVRSVDDGGLIPPC